MNRMILEEHRGIGLGNLSSRISEILHMPTPARKLQPILKPIKSYKRPKAAFKKRTPLRIQNLSSASTKRNSKLRLNQMLGSSVLQTVEHGFLVQEAEIRALPKIRPSKPAAQNPKLNFTKSRAVTEPSNSNVIVIDADTDSAEVRNTNMADEQSKKCHSQSSSKSGLPFTDQSELFKDMDIEPGTNTNENVSVTPDASVGKAKNHHPGRGFPIKRVDHIVLPTASLESVSSEKSSGDKAKHVVFPCLQLPRSTEKLSVPKGPAKQQTDIDKNRPFRLKKRIMTLLELVSKRDRSLKVKNNSVVPTSEFESSVRRPREKAKKERYTKLNSDRKHQRYKSQEKSSFEGALGQGHSSEITNKRHNGHLMFEDFDDAPFNLNNDNWASSPLKPSTKQSSEENHGMWYSG
ncbi:hypothetical protein ACHWQZ_G000428 [Mnemiopsis leidyi]